MGACYFDHRGAVETCFGLSPMDLKMGARIMNLFRSMDEVKRSFIYSMRSIRRNPFFSLVAICTLALGIGACSTVFSILEAVVLLLEP
jgi:hypothetical protein